MALDCMLPDVIDIGGTQYQIKQKLGSGANGAVHLVIDIETRLPYAIKFLPRNSVEGKYLKTEVLNHRLLEHPHVVQFHAVFATEHHICILMEIAIGFNLRTYLELPAVGRLDEVQARYIFQQLVIAVDYCHQKHISNRDLKLENTLLHWEQGIASGLRPVVKVSQHGLRPQHGDALGLIRTLQTQHCAR
jgi:serine/threonine-protein kinase SRK2